MNSKAKSPSAKANLFCFGEGCLYFIFYGFLIKFTLQIKQEFSEETFGTQFNHVDLASNFPHG